MEWYREQTIQLIDLFRARPALWDTSSVHYRNKRMKNEALEQISAKLKCPKEEIAKKICTLRVQFSRENVKVKRAQEAGTVYNPKWFGYQLLCFLNDQSRFSTGLSAVSSYAAAVAAAHAAVQHQDGEQQQFQWRAPLSDDNSYVESVNDTNTSSYEADSAQPSAMHGSSKMEYHHHDMDDYREPIVDVQEHKVLPQMPWQNRKHRAHPDDDSDVDDVGGGGGGGAGYRKMLRLSSKPPAETDGFNTFSDYIAERVRNLKGDKVLQLMARRDIEQVLFKYEMMLLEQKRDAQPETMAATTSKSISPTPTSDSEQQ